MNLVSKLIAIIVVLVTIICTNILMGLSALPNYGVWTGIRPLEDKLKKLEEFVKEGPVDAIVLGSFIADFGFSAELYSRLMSEKLGIPTGYLIFRRAGPSW